MLGRTVLLAMMVCATLVLGGCAATGTESSTGPSTAPSSGGATTATSASVVTASTTEPTGPPDPVTGASRVPTTEAPPAPTTRRTTRTPDRSSGPAPAPNPMVPDVSDAGGAVPACGYEQPELTSEGPETTPAPDTCQFTGGSPACTGAVTTIIDGADRREVEPTGYPLTMIVSAFARWGGRAGAAMCFAELSDQSVTMTNGDEGIRVLHSANPIIFVERTDLARSAGLRGVVAADVASVVIRDPARPLGVRAMLGPLNAGNGSAVLPSGAEPAQILIAPVSSGPATVTAYDSSGAGLGTVTVP